MDGRRKPHSKRNRPQAGERGTASGKPVSALHVQRIAPGGPWELVHPRCARDRAEDLEEVQQMLGAGEFEIARDELRWLVQGCNDFVAAHKLLGELALAENDLPLARGHFGYAFRLGSAAAAQARLPGPLPYELPGNRDFFEAGKGLAWCLEQLGFATMAAEVIDELLRLDPADPLGLAELRAQLEKRDSPEP